MCQEWTKEDSLWYCECMESPSSPTPQTPPSIQPQPPPIVPAEAIASKKGNPFFIILLIIFLCGIVGAVWFFFVPKNIPSVPMQKACTMEAKICPDGSSVGRTGPDCAFSPCPTVTSPMVQPSLSPTPPQISTTDDKAALIAMVKASEVARIGADANASTYTVSLIQGNYAQGMASASAGGAIWFAAKVNGTWKLVFIGNGTVQCSDFTSYPDFPNTMIPDCWDAVNQKTVIR